MQRGSAASASQGWGSAAAMRRGSAAEQVWGFVATMRRGSPAALRRGSRRRGARVPSAPFAREKLPVPAVCFSFFTCRDLFWWAVLVSCRVKTIRKLNPAVGLSLDGGYQHARLIVTATSPTRGELHPHRRLPSTRVAASLPRRPSTHHPPPDPSRRLPSTSPTSTQVVLAEEVHGSGRGRPECQCGMWSRY
jgi:hypothetical protein